MCTTCRDTDNDSYYVNCDRYQTINGPDCNDSNSYCDSNCTDSDNDSYCINHDCDDTSSWCNFDCSDTNNNSVFDCKETWILTLGGSDYDYAESVIETSDNGFLVAGMTSSYEAGGDIWVIKLNSSGEIGSCDLIQDTNVTAQDSNATVQDTTVTPQDSNAVPEFICPQ